MKVSVIVPSYNCQDTIERCVRSIVEQNGNTSLKEVLIINDGSLDNTKSVVEQLCLLDQRIKVINKSNGGVSSARNAGIDHATGEWIMFVDSDDELKPGLLSKMFEKANGADMIVAGVELLQDTGKTEIACSGNYRAQDAVSEYGKSIPSLLLNGPWSKLYKRDITVDKGIRFDESVSLGEDTLFVFNYLKSCQSICFVDYCGYKYYQMGTASLMTKFREDGYENAKKVYGELLRIFGAINNEQTPAGMEQAYTSALTTYLRNLIAHRSEIDKSLINNTVQDYVNDTIVRKVLRTRKNQNILQRVLAFLVKKRMYWLYKQTITLHVCARGL